MWGGAIQTPTPFEIDARWQDKARISHAECVLNLRIAIEQANRKKEAVQSIKNSLREAVWHDHQHFTYEMILLSHLRISTHSHYYLK